IVVNRLPDPLADTCLALRELATMTGAAVVGAVPMDLVALELLVETGRRPAGVPDDVALLVARPHLEPEGDDSKMLADVGWCPANGDLLLIEPGGRDAVLLVHYVLDEEGVRWWIDRHVPNRDGDCPECGRTSGFTNVRGRG